MKFFYFLRHFNSATLQEVLNRENRQRFLNLLTPIAQTIYWALLTILKMIVKHIIIRIIRFFQFILYLNFHTIKEVCTCAAKRRLSGLSSEMAYNAMLALFPGLWLVRAILTL